MEVARGHVTDRPFARTIYSLGAQRFTGELLLCQGKGKYRTSWKQGQIVAAHSTSPADAAGRIALAQGLVTSSGLAELARQRASGTSDVIDQIVELARLSPAQCTRLRHGVFVSAAARVFALPTADFWVNTTSTIQQEQNLSPIDVRWLVYFGLRSHYSLQRLRHELSAVGERKLRLVPAMLSTIPTFGFGDPERLLLETLQAQEYSLNELIAACPQLDEATTACVVYSLMACSYLTVVQTVTPEEGPCSNDWAKSPQTDAHHVDSEEDSRGREGQRVASASASAAKEDSRGREGQRAAASASAAKEDSRGREDQRAASASASAAKEDSRGREDQRAAASASAAKEDSQGREDQRAAASASAAKETKELIWQRLQVMDKRGDHYQVLDVAHDADQDSIRRNYFALARRLHPDRLQALGIVDMSQESQCVFSAINKAFSVLSNAKLRRRYQEILAAGGEEAYAMEQQRAEDETKMILLAEEHFRVGEMALRRNQLGDAEMAFQKAVELNPNESEYVALHTWCSYCRSPDRATIAREMGARMATAVRMNPKNVSARLHHAKLLKLMGRHEEAIASYRVLLQLEPDHREGQLELRLLREEFK